MMSETLRLYMEEQGAKGDVVRGGFNLHRHVFSALRASKIISTSVDRESYGFSTCFGVRALLLYIQCASFAIHNLTLEVNKWLNQSSSQR